MAKDPIGYQQASINAATVINSFGVVGQRTMAGRLLEEAGSINGGFTLRFERAWEVEAYLSLDFRPNMDEKFGKEHTRMIPRVTVNFPATNRTPMEAMAALALYREITELAALLQTQLDGEAMLV